MHSFSMVKLEPRSLILLKETKSKILWLLTKHWGRGEWKVFTTLNHITIKNHVSFPPISHHFSVYAVNQCKFRKTYTSTGQIPGKINISHQFQFIFLATSPNTETGINPQSSHFTDWHTEKTQCCKTYYSDPSYTYSFFAQWVSYLIALLIKFQENQNFYKQFYDSLI